MKLSLVFFVLLALIGFSFASKCDSCKASVKDIKDGKGLAYMANLTTKQIEDYVTKNVNQNCSGSDCAKLIRSLIEIADQLDDDLDATPEELCKFVYFC
ncbi:hypothetical protein L5515_009926 [Caenorhabditis briggsae]|uniref:Saposin B-type domain-containing protein n=1 Tax=Caenorhabditis briggsae TaxID=6238 RepID=A0AAE9JPB3_CAEBR|nr:hypothetical protein L5515_009926 [Caenorhabditis briggsae]